MIPTETSPGEPDSGATSAKIAALCAAVLPVWSRHLAEAQAQSEKAVTEMLSAFSEIGPHLNLAERQSKEITAALAQSEDGVTLLAQGSRALLEPLAARLDPAAANTIAQVLGMIDRSVGALQQMAEPFDHETRMVAQQVERMYIGFQYQDRINQMMSLLFDDMQRLCRVAERPDSSLESVTVEGWLTELESRYAMAEQRHGHAQATQDNAGLANGQSEETVFF